LVESLDVSVMETTLTDAGGRVHLALTATLLAACSVNLLLACAWLQP
jgi:hypothetical protein